MKNLNKNKTYISLLKQNGLKAYAQYLENGDKTRQLKILEDYIKIITEDKNSDQIKEIRNRYLKRFERKNV
ncbi:MAG: hypothetical protein AB7E04_04750 [Desulfobacteraceae bacterium]